MPSLTFRSPFSSRPSVQTKVHNQVRQYSVEHGETDTNTSSQRRPGTTIMSTGSPTTNTISFNHNEANLTQNTAAIATNFERFAAIFNNPKPQISNPVPSLVREASTPQAVNTSIEYLKDSLETAASSSIGVATSALKNIASEIPGAFGGIVEAIVPQVKHEAETSPEIDEQKLLEDFQRKLQVLNTTTANIAQVRAERQAAEEIRLTGNTLNGLNGGEANLSISVTLDNHNFRTINTALAVFRRRNAQLHAHKAEFQEQELKPPPGKGNNLRVDHKEGDSVIGSTTNGGTG